VIKEIYNVLFSRPKIFLPILAGLTAWFLCALGFFINTPLEAMPSVSQIERLLGDNLLRAWLRFLLEALEDSAMDGVWAALLTWLAVITALRFRRAQA
jgi:hypothetical protein